MRGAVLRLERRVREERIVIRRFDCPRRARERAFRIAVVVELDDGGLLRQLLRAFVEDGRVVRCRWPFVPRELQLRPRLLRMPPRVSDDGDAAMQADTHAADGI